MFPRSRARVAVVVLAVWAAFAVAQAAPAAPGASGGSVARVSALEAGVLVDMNALRRSHGLVPLRVSPALAAAAQQHSRSMAAGGFFRHESADGSAFWKRIARFYKEGRGYWSVGENLLWSSPDVDPGGAIQMWLNSPPHRKNLLTARWREVGISAIHVAAAPGVFGGREVTIVTADFGVRR
jgi:uncharacterized protein YkwD